MLTGPHFSPARLEAVRARIAAAERRAGREPGYVRLLAVSKQQPVEAIESAFEAGQLEFGENYVQEAVAKIGSLRGRPLTWHFIGRVQGNKTREIAEHFQWVHTVDRERIATRLDAQRPPLAPPLEVLLQVRLGDEPAKGGATPEELPSLADAVSRLPRLRLRGLMCIPPPARDEAAQRVPFRRLRELLEELNQSGHALDVLSMGMSDDLEAAVLEGATLVRIGTAVFGPRN
jgi:pyridoxal phosphate enzyme (YggS family)